MTSQIGEACTTTQSDLKSMHEKIAQYDGEIEQRKHPIVESEGQIDTKDQTIHDNAVTMGKLETSKQALSQRISALETVVTENEAEQLKNKLLLEESCTAHETSKRALATAEHSQTQDSEEIAHLHRKLGEEGKHITKEKARSEGLQQQLQTSQDDVIDVY